VIATDTNTRRLEGLLVSTCCVPSRLWSDCAQGQTASAVVSGSKPYLSYTIPANSGDALSVRSASFTPGFSARWISMIQRGPGSIPHLRPFPQDCSGRELHVIVGR